MNFDKYKAEKPGDGFASRLAGKVSAADGEYVSELAALPERKQSAGAWRTVLSVAAIFAVLVAAGAWILIGLGLRNGGKIVPAGEGTHSYAVRVNRDRDIVKEDRAAMQGFFNDYVAEKACDLELSFLFPDEQHPMRYALTADEYGRVHNSVTTSPTGDHAYSDRDFYHLKFVLGGGDEQGMYLYYIKEGDDTPSCEYIRLDLGFIENSAENGSRVFDYSKSEPIVIENGLVVSGEKSLADFLQSCGRRQYAYAEIRQDGELSKVRLTGFAKPQSEDGVTAIYAAKLVRLTGDNTAGLTLLTDGEEPRDPDVSIPLNTGELDRLMQSSGLYSAVISVKTEGVSPVTLDQYGDKAEYTALEKAFDFSGIELGDAVNWVSAHIITDYYVDLYGAGKTSFFRAIGGGWIVEDFRGSFDAKIPKELEERLDSLYRSVKKDVADVQTDTEPEPQENVNVPEIASEYKLDFMPEFTEDNYDIGYYYYYCLYAYALDGFPEQVRGKRFNEVLKMLSCPVTVPDGYYVPIIIEGVPMRYCDRTAVSFKDGVVTAKYNVYDYGYEYTEEQVKAACERGDAEQTIGCDERFTVRYETDGGMKPTRFLSCEHEYKNESGEWERPDGAGEYFRSGERARAALESWLEQNPDVKAYKTAKAVGEMKDGFGKFGVWTELIPADGKKDWFLQNGFKESQDSEWLTCRSGFAFIENEDGSYTYVPGAQDANSAAEALSKLSENELKDAALRAFDKSMKERGKKAPFKEYKVNSVDIRPTSGAARDDGEYTISVSYDVKPKKSIFSIFGSGDSWLAGNGAEGEDGWIVGKSEIIYADLRDGEFSFNSVGTGP